MASTDDSARRGLNKCARISLVLADGHPLVLQGMLHLFGSEPDFDVLACCGSEQETRRAVDRYQPDVVVVDLRLPERGGLAMLGDLLVEHPSTRTVLLTNGATVEEMAQALGLGVHGVVTVALASQLLVKCIRHVHEGARWLEHASVSVVLTHMARRDSSLKQLRNALTRRELQILELVARGLRNKEITAQLNITEGTVKIHLHNICTKLGLKSRLDLVLHARDAALV